MILLQERSYLIFKFHNKNIYLKISIIHLYINFKRLIYFAVILRSNEH